MVEPILKNVGNRGLRVTNWKDIPRLAHGQVEKPSTEVTELKRRIIQTPDKREKTAVAKELGKMLLELTDPEAIALVAIYHENKEFRLAAIEKLDGNPSALRNVAEKALDNETKNSAVTRLAKLAGTRITAEELKQVATEALIVSPGQDYLSQLKRIWRNE